MNPGTNKLNWPQIQLLLQKLREDIPGNKNLKALEEALVNPGADISVKRVKLFEEISGNLPAITEILSLSGLASMELDDHFTILLGQ